MLAYTYTHTHTPAHTHTHTQPPSHPATQPPSHPMGLLCPPCFLEHQCRQYSSQDTGVAHTHTHTLGMTLCTTEVIPWVRKLVSFLQSHLFNHMSAQHTDGLPMGTDEEATALMVQLWAPKPVQELASQLSSWIIARVFVAARLATSLVPTVILTCRAPSSQGGTHMHTHTHTLELQANPGDEFSRVISTPNRVKDSEEASKIKC